MEIILRSEKFQTMLTLKLSNNSKSRLVANHFGPRSGSTFVSPDREPNGLQRLSADDMSVL